MLKFKYSDQQAFDKVAVALVAQGGRSTDGGRCVYEASNGFRCAAGHLLPKRTPKKVLSFVGEWGRLLGDYPEYNTIADYDLVRVLQEAHDNTLDCFRSWTEEMRAVAIDFKLNTVKFDRALKTKGV